MTNDELQMTKEIRSSKVERRAGVRSAVSSFGFRYSFGFRHSLVGFGNCGSWRAPFRFFSSIGTVNRSRGGNAAADLLIAISAATSQWRVPGCFLMLLTLLAVGGFTSTSLAATFTASLDRSTVSVNENATMSLKFEGGLPADVPAMPNVPGLSIA